jgi:positive phototaxis protein PixI
MNSSALAPHSSRIQKTLGEPYLKVQVGSQSFVALVMHHVQEVMVLPIRRLTPMPNKPACLLGLTNRRSRVLWVIDLARMLGLGALQANVQQHSVVVMQVGNIPLGLAIQHVEEITWIPSDAIQSTPGPVSQALLPYLQGCWVQPQGVVLILDALAIAHSPLLHGE